MGVKLSASPSVDQRLELPLPPPPRKRGVTSVAGIPDVLVAHILAAGRSAAKVWAREIKL
jgi:hypothetical protein